jgi:hypothetical protein
MDFRFTRARFILCEGDDDKGFLESLIHGRAGMPEFQVCHAAECNPQRTGGKTAFAKSLAGIEPISGFEAVKALLLVLDNDVLGEAFAEAQKALADNGHTPPATPDGIGQVAGRPVSILMIPRYDIAGDLELFSLPAIHERWPIAEGCVDAFLRCTGANGWGDKPGSLNKARARSAIVGCNKDDPYKGIGHLFRQGVLSVMNPCFNEIAEFLQNFDARLGVQ